MLSSVGVNVIGFALVIALATIWAAWWETGPRGATPGKRLVRLGLVDARTRASPTPRQSLVRNVIKIAVPWELGHTVALGFANVGSQLPIWLWVLTAITYGWVLGNVVLLVLPSGKPVHDRLAGTVIVRTTT
jgi:uncharacterized RDD family membrane protein YckC